MRKKTNFRSVVPIVLFSIYALRHGNYEKFPIIFAFMFHYFSVRKLPGIPTGLLIAGKLQQPELFRGITETYLGK